MSWWPAVLAIVGFVAFLGVMELACPGSVWEPRRVYDEPPALDRPTDDVTCREIEEDFETRYALSVKVAEELKLPERVRKEDAEIGAQEAIWDACDAADPDKHPVDSDFKGSLRAKLVRGKR